MHVRACRGEEYSVVCARLIECGDDGDRHLVNCVKESQGRQDVLDRQGFS